MGAAESCVANAESGSDADTAEIYTFVNNAPATHSDNAGNVTLQVREHHANSYGVDAFELTELDMPPALAVPNVISHQQPDSQAPQASVRCGHKARPSAVLMKEGFRERLRREQEALEKEKKQRAAEERAAALEEEAALLKQIEDLEHQKRRDLELARQKEKLNAKQRRQKELERRRNLAAVEKRRRDMREANLAKARSRKLRQLSDAMDTRDAQTSRRRASIEARSPAAEQRSKKVLADARREGLEALERIQSPQNKREREQARIRAQLRTEARLQSLHQPPPRSPGATVPAAPHPNSAHAPTSPQHSTPAKAAVSSQSLTNSEPLSASVQGGVAMEAAIQSNSPSAPSAAAPQARRVIMSFPSVHEKQVSVDKHDTQSVASTTANEQDMLRRLIVVSRLHCCALCLPRPRFLTI